MTDWSRVTRAVYRVRHHYRYSYNGPVWDIKQRLIMIPPRQDGDQRVLEHDLAVRGYKRGRGTWIGDGFGNRVATYLDARVAAALRSYRSSQPRLEVNGRRPAPWKADGRVSRYLRPTALTAPNETLRDAAQEIFRASGDPRERAERAHNWASGSITYQFGVTGYTTPAAMALHFQKGVCQDFAHILLALLRILDIPAGTPRGTWWGRSTTAWSGLIPYVMCQPTVEVTRTTRPLTGDAMDYILVATAGLRRRQPRPERTRPRAREAAFTKHRTSGAEHDTAGCR